MLLAPALRPCCGVGVKPPLLVIDPMVDTLFCGKRVLSIWVDDAEDSLAESGLVACLRANGY